MALQYLYFSSSGNIGGGNWNLKSSSNLRSSTTTSSNGNGPNHQCNNGSGRSSAYGWDNFAPAFSSITSIYCYNQHRRSTTTHNNKNRIETYNGTAWDYGALRNPVNSWYTDYISPPTGGWTKARVDAMYCKWYHSSPVNTSNAYLYFDYMRMQVTYVLPSGESVITWALPLVGALPFLSDFAKYINFCRKLAHMKVDPGAQWHEEWGRYTENEYRIIRDAIKRPKHFIKRNGLWLPTICPST